MEIDLLRLDLAERDRRLEKYENSDSPSSKDSLYNAERAAFRKLMEREDADGQQDGPESKDGDKIHRGRLQDTRASRMATRQKGRSHCMCANARHAGAGVSPMCHT